MAPLPRLAVVEFPGRLRDPTNPKRAIEAIGGEKAVLSYVSTPPGPSVPSLSLNLRPSNQVSQSNIRADPPYTATNLFLIQVYPPSASASSAHVENKITKESDSNGVAAAASQDKTGDGDGDATIDNVKLVGRVTAMTEFSSLADFQYHPSPRSIDPYGTPDGVGIPHRRPGHQSMASPPIAERIFHSLTYRPASKLTLEECIDRLRPFRFSRSAPERGNFNYWYRQYSIPAHLFQQQFLKPGPLMFIPGQPLGNDRRSLPDRLRRLPHRVPYSIDTVPTAPPVTPDPIVRGRVEYAKLVTLLRLLFEERPVWIRRSLLLGVPEELRTAFKKAIQCVAYSFQGSGPFFQACVKYGYDPRKDPSARKYQVLEIRCGHPLLEAVRNIRAEKTEIQETETVKDQPEGPSPFTFGEPGGKKKRRNRKKNVTEEELEEQLAGVKDVTTDLFDMPKEFVLEGVPEKKNNFFQVCDIKIPSITEIIDKQPLREQYNVKSGFFSETSFSLIHKQTKKAIFHLAEEYLGQENAGKIMKGNYRVVSKMVSTKRGRLHLKDVMKDGGSTSKTKKGARQTRRSTRLSAASKGLKLFEQEKENAAQTQCSAADGDDHSEQQQDTNDQMSEGNDGEAEDNASRVQNSDIEDAEGEVEDQNQGDYDELDAFEEDENMENEDDADDDDEEEEEGDEEEEENYDFEGLAGFEVYDSDDDGDGANGGDFEDDEDDYM